MKKIIYTMTVLLMATAVIAQHNYDNQGVLYSHGNNTLTVGTNAIQGSYGGLSSNLELRNTDGGLLALGGLSGGAIKPLFLIAGPYGTGMYFDQNVEFNFFGGENILKLRGKSMTSGGSVLVGTDSSPEGYKLAVGGKIIAEEVKVSVQSSWPDFVFKPDYRLSSLYEVESFIKTNGHLMHMPPAAEVETDGFMLAEMDAKLLQQIEELTLHTIEQQKLLDAQKDQLAKQKKKIEALESVLKRLEELEAKVRQIEQH
ncbi:MAG: hypothetical protein HEP71_31325 [Roseivirga sp.]|nr:hypothetical protein [Roseivirga sp.]